MKTLIIGCGLIGRKRALAFNEEDTLVACCDINEELAKKFAQEFNCRWFTDYKVALSEVDCDVVIVAVINKYIKEIVTEAIKLGKHVVAEKPLGRNASEAGEMIKTLESWKSEMLNNSNSPSIHQSINPIFQHSNIPVFKTGFNHRFHPAIWKAKQLCNDGKVGSIFNIRAKYGHGGRPGMEKEWRASKDLCGGGELLDQGVHIIDLISWFGGEIKEVFGKAETKFWSLEVEDNAMAILKTQNNVSASMHVSWTNWKNVFSFEIFGTDGYLKIEGLGGSYGPETLEYGIRKKEGGRPDVECFEFPSEDISWKEEWKEFKSAISENREVIGSGYDGLKANEVIQAIYKSDREGKVITL